MNCILKYRFVDGELCLEMNKEFMSRVEVLQEIFKKIYNSDDIDYEKIAMLNYDYLKSKFCVDDTFINWWQNIVTNEYYIVLKILKGILLPGFYLIDGHVRSDYGKNSNFWENFLLFDGVCRDCLLARNNCGIPHYCGNYEHYGYMLQIMHEMEKKYERIKQDLKEPDCLAINLDEEPKLIEKPYCSSFPRCRLEVPEPRL